MIVMVWVIVFANANRNYSASDVLGNHADLNAENPFVSVDIESIVRGTEDIFTSIEIPEENTTRTYSSF